ncbi:MBL fold metallo-hydrolase [Candidatus Bathyarchaeota archaeon]|nr:MBL fold metallo-hydrolase [Candidatus Bathyarchaeota archaeon]
MAVDFVTYTQRRWTGGIRFIDGPFQAHLDPGPGAVVRSVDAGFSIEKVRLLLVSHSHPDHCCDASVFLEGMTHGTTKHRGSLIAATSVLSGNEFSEPSISKYHQSLMSNVFEAHPGDHYQVEGIGVQVVKALHTDPDGVGFVLEFPGVGKIGYTSDTAYFDGIVDPYQGMKLLILCITRPRKAPLKGHLTTDDAAIIVGSSKPEMAVLTHFGMRILNDSSSAQAKYVQDSTGIQTVAAFDRMVVTLEKSMKITSLENRKQNIWRRDRTHREPAHSAGFRKGNTGF